MGYEGVDCIIWWGPVREPVKSMANNDQQDNIGYPATIDQGQHERRWYRQGSSLALRRQIKLSFDCGDNWMTYTRIGPL